MKDNNTPKESLKDLESKIDTLAVKLLVAMRRELYADFTAYTVAMQEYHYALGYKEGFEDEVRANIKLINQRFNN